MAVELTILGFNSATPTANSNPSAQLLNINERYLLIDCGEGTQVQLRRAKAKFSKINHIFISHLHGDHVFGLIGLISTFQLLGRKKSLEIFGPKGIKDFIENQLKHTHSISSFELIFHELETKESQLIYSDKKIEVYNLPLKHRIYCNGYLFKEKPKLRILDIETVKSIPEIKTCDYSNLKNGKDFIKENGKVIPNDKLTFQPPKPFSYAYCSDTMYNEELINHIKGVDLLYHEATFLDELSDLAKKTGHSTAKEAAEIAQKAEVKKLIIGHFSNRYRDFNLLLNEAQSVFPNTELPVTLKKMEF